MKIIDTHSHLFLEEFSEDLPEVMRRAREAGVTHIFMPNIDSSTVDAMNRVCREYAGFCFPMIGLHPTSVDAGYERELERVERELEGAHGYVAIGEIGMDLYWDKTYRQEQEEVLRRQLDWALAYNLPVAIHCREAFEPIYNIMCDYRDKPLRGIMHSFTGTWDEAQSWLEFPGLLLGINGVVTFKKSALPEVVRRLPLERVVLETDSPYLTPAPHRGKRNESSRVRDTLMKVAEVCGVSAEQVAQITTENALKLFGMPK